MKYFVFNIAVFLALGYLIMGGDTSHLQAGLESRVEKAKAKIEQAVKQEEEPIQSFEPIVQEIPKQVVAETPVLQEEPEVIQEEVKKPVAPPPLPKAMDVAKVTPKEAPSRARPQVVEEPVSVAAVIEAPKAEPAEKALVDTKERSRELRQMVADMERMFAEKMTR